MNSRIRLVMLAGMATLALALSFFVAACGGDKNEPTPEPTSTAAAAQVTPTGAGLTPEATEKATSLTVSLSEWAITAEGGGALASVPAGEIAFQVQNAGEIPHEFVIVKTDTDPATFPVSGGKVDEETIGELIGEVEEIQAGETKTGTFGLQPGTYALICNIAGHYEQGMHAQLTVE